MPYHTNLRADSATPADAGELCLLTTLHPERALSRALVQHLVAEIPGVNFTLRESPGVRTVWVCGYERGSADRIRDLRARHPEALILVTGRGPRELFQGEVEAAGADLACSWPVPYGELERLLSGPRPQRVR